MNFVEQTISINNIKMMKIIVEINFEFRAIKYQKIKQIKFKISFKTFKTFEKLKRFVQIFKKQLSFVDITKQILNTSIEIQFRELFKISLKLSRQIFRDIIDEEMKTIFKKRKTIVQMRVVKEKKMHVESIKFNSIE